MKTNTYLPCFPGFYGTIYEADIENECEFIQNERTSNGLPEITNWDKVVFDYEGYEDEVATNFVNTIGGILKNMNVISNISFQSVYSPREYNFDNDSIYIEIEYTEDNLKTIKNIIANNSKMFETYIVEKFTSYDGFISFYSNKAADWMDLSEIMNHQTKAGVILQFICNVYVNNEYENEIDFFEYLYEQCNANISSIDSETYTTAPICSKCGDFISNKWAKKIALNKLINTKELSFDSFICDDCKALL